MSGASFGFATSSAPSARSDELTCPGNFGADWSGICLRSSGKERYAEIYREVPMSLA